MKHEIQDASAVAKWQKEAQRIFWSIACGFRGERGRWSERGLLINWRKNMKWSSDRSRHNFTYLYISCWAPTSSWHSFGPAWLQESREEKNARKSTRRCARFTCIDWIQCIDCIDCGDCRDCKDCKDCRMYGLQRLYTYMDCGDCSDQQLKISHKTFLWDIFPS